MKYSFFLAVIRWLSLLMTHLFFVFDCMYHLDLFVVIFFMFTVLKWFACSFQFL